MLLWGASNPFSTPGRFSVVATPVAKMPSTFSCYLQRLGMSFLFAEPATFQERSIRHYTTCVRQNAARNHAA